jgi:hypothetical protein
MPTPNVPLDILDRIGALEERLRQVEGRTQIRPALNEIVAGTVTVGEGGEFRVLDTDGTKIFWVGGITPAHTDGSPQRGTLMRREDGSLAFAVYTGGPENQGVFLWDKSGNGLLIEDVVGGGLCRPYLSTDAWFGATEAPTFTTTSGTFVTLQHLPWQVQHPRVTGYYLVQAAAGTSGEIRLVDDSGTVVLGPLAIGTAAFTFGSLTGPLAQPFGTWTYLHWQARVTGGAGAIGIKGLSTFGVQS